MWGSSEESLDEFNIEYLSLSWVRKRTHELSTSTPMSYDLISSTAFLSTYRILQNVWNIFDWRQQQLWAMSYPSYRQRHKRIVLPLISEATCWEPFVSKKWLNRILASNRKNPAADLWDFSFRFDKKQNDEESALMALTSTRTAHFNHERGSWDETNA